MANPGDLTTIVNAFTRIESTAPPGVLAALISACSASIQNVIGYQIASQDYAATFNGAGGQKLMLPNYPITAVSAVTISNTTIPAAQDQVASGFLFDAKAVYLRGYTFERGVQNVSIAYTAGYTATPFDLEQACLDWVTMAYDQVGRSADIEAVKAGDTQFNYTAALAAAGAIPGSILRNISSYIRVFPG